MVYRQQLSILSLIFLVVFNTLAMTVDQPAELAACLHDAQQRPTPALQALLQLCGLPFQGTIAELFEDLKAAFKRPTGVERWMIQEKYPEKFNEIRDCCEQLCLINEIEPQGKQFDYCIIPGASLNGVRMRLAHSIYLWKEGVRWRKMIFLGCERPLDEKQEPLEVLYNERSTISSKEGCQKPASAPKTEYEMMRMVHDQAQLPFENISEQWINTPNKLEKEKLVRANTADTVNDLSTNPEKGSCLIISNQPFVGYQHEVFASLLPGFRVQTVGAEASDETMNAVVLDALTSWLWWIINKKLKPA
jgi:hypothetical protein